MTKLEIFMLYELINKAAVEFNIEIPEIPMFWFDELIGKSSELTDDEKCFLIVGDGSLIDVLNKKSKSKIK